MVFMEVNTHLNFKVLLVIVGMRRQVVPPL